MLYWYFIAINIFTFIVRGVDKFKAMKGWWRISEKQLLTLVALGGVVGAFLGMSFFRHKTIKGTFLFKLYGIIFGRIIIIVLYTKDPALLESFLGSLS